ncbi:hypothetical protein [Nocardia sp. NPDC057227]|uniref:hypothetical protein n=1 Tax=Nocardia sp. NPDC057227 TaxID=3346056 RepID=UPI0036379BA6
MSAPARTGRASVLALAGALTSQAALLTALLYYIGWVYSHAWYRYYGIDVAMLGYSIPDYILRSPNAALPPLMLGLVAALAGIAIARRLPAEAAVRNARRRRLLRGWRLLVVALGVLALAGALLTQFFKPAAPPWVVPLLLLAGALLLGHTIDLGNRYPAVLGARPERGAGHAVLALGVVAVIWTVGAYADALGGANARRTAESGFPEDPQVLVFSVDRLAVEGTSAGVAEVTAPGEKYRYVYSGLRMIGRSTDGYLLVPQGWRRGRDRVFVVPRADGIRIDIAALPP